MAVVALLKDLGTDAKLGTMIEGESLLNDGSAVVLFMILMAWIKFDPNVFPIGGPSIPTFPDGGEDGGVWTIGVEVLRVVAQMLFFGIVYGYGWGYVVRKLLGRVVNEGLVEVSIVGSL